MLEREGGTFSSFLSVFVEIYYGTKIMNPNLFISYLCSQNRKNMALGKEILFFFSALGAFNGLLLSAYLIFFIKKRGLSHYFLGVLLLASSIRVGKSVLLYFSHNLPKIYLQIGLSACFFIGPALFFFLKSSLNPLKRLPTVWKIHLSILFALILVGGILFPYQTHPFAWNRIYVPIIYTEWAVYIVLSGIVVKDILKKIVLRHPDVKILEQWLASVYGLNVLIFAAYLWAYWGGLYISGAITFSFVLYIGFFVLINRKKNDDLFSNTVRAYPKKISDDEAQRWLNQLEKLMSEKQLFKNTNLKLQDLAEAMNLSAHQLSQFLNEHIGKKFTQYVNEYRIEEACKLLETNTLLSVEGIGDEVGFNSKSTFFAAFKKIKGLTPASYQQRFVKG
jgi:AraC-like DNA-binding protein